MNRFEELLSQLGDTLNIDIQPDAHGLCKILVDHLIHIQIEYDPDKERLMFGTFIAEIPPGKFRESVLKEGLKANYPFPTFGIFAYSQRNNSLAFFSYIYSFNLNGEKLAKILSQFVEIAKQWKQAINAGFFAPPPNPR